MAKKPAANQPRILNKKARHQYHIIDTLEAGIALTGTEVKSLRAGAAQITDSFVRVSPVEANLYNAQIDRYPPATVRNHEPLRTRRLLLHRRELRRLAQELNRPGTTLVPLTLYFNARGLAKVELALVMGKKEYDKRQDLRKREHQRDIERAMRSRQSRGRQ